MSRTATKGTVYIHYGNAHNLPMSTVRFSGTKAALAKHCKELDANGEVYTVQIVNGDGSWSSYGKLAPKRRRRS